MKTRDVSTAYPITIEVDPPGLVPSGGSVGNFVYKPALLRVEDGDTITWHCQYPFTLVFKAGTPIDQMEVWGNAITGGGFSSDLYTVSDDVKGMFHYAVAVWKDGRVLMDVACAGLSVN